MSREVTRTLDDYSFECDGQPGKLNQIEIPFITKPTRFLLVGTIKLIELREHERWEPIASVSFARERMDWSSLQFYFTSRSPGKMTVRIIRSEFKKAQTETVIALEITNIPVPFSFEMFADGRMVATVAGETRNLLANPIIPLHVALSCSTGRFKFGSVSLVEEE